MATLVDSSNKLGGVAGSETRQRARPNADPAMRRELDLSEQTIRDLIVPIAGHEELKRSLLCGELRRYRASLEWMDPSVGGSLIDMGACGDLAPIYARALAVDRICCLDRTNHTGPARQVHESGEPFDFECFKVDLERDPFPFDDQTFDQAVVMEIVEHLAVDPMFMLAEANRVLKHAAPLLLTTPNLTAISCLYNLLWSRHPSPGMQAFGPGIMDRHHREYTPSDVAGMVEAAGFTVVKLDTFNGSPPDATMRHVRRLLKVLRWFRPEIDLDLRNDVIRCLCRKTSQVIERFPRHLYPRYRYYDYSTYDRELSERFSGRRYWGTSFTVEDPRARVDFDATKRTASEG